jgi:hypothetical protein
MANNEMAYVAAAALTRGQCLIRVANVAGVPTCDVATDGTIATAQIHIGVADADYAIGDRLTPSRGFVWAQVTVGVLTPGTDYRLTVDPFGFGVGQLEATAAATDQVIATFEGSAATGGVAGELTRVNYHGSSGQL